MFQAEGSGHFGLQDWALDGLRIWIGLLGIFGCTLRLMSQGMVKMGCFCQFSPGNVSLNSPLVGETKRKRTVSPGCSANHLKEFPTKQALLQSKNCAVVRVKKVSSKNAVLQVKYRRKCDAQFHSFSLKPALQQRTERGVSEFGKIRISNFFLRSNFATACRVQSVGGAERVSNPDGKQEQMSVVESSASQKDSGEIQQESEVDVSEQEIHASTEAESELESDGDDSSGNRHALTAAERKNLEPGGDESSEYLASTVAERKNLEPDNYESSRNHASTVAERKNLEPGDDESSGRSQNGKSPDSSHDGTMQSSTTIEEEEQIDEEGQEDEEEDQEEENKEKDLLQEEYGTEPDWDEEIPYVTRIPVPRQRYIPVPKVDLVNVLLLSFFPAKTDSSNFLSMCSYLELILHAEHKLVLEELRTDYNLTHSLPHGNIRESSRFLRVKGVTNTSKLGPFSAERALKQKTVGDKADWPVELPPEKQKGEMQGEKQLSFNFLKELGKRLKATLKPKYKKLKNIKDSVVENSPCSDIHGDAREAAAERFQKNFMKELRNAEFEGMSVRDLELTAALNSDYLLTLPVDVDWKGATSSHTRIFRRGYTTEEQKGLLLGEKLDYLQSYFLRKTFKLFTGPLLAAGSWFIEKWASAWKDNEGGRALAEGLSRWLQEPLEPGSEAPNRVTTLATDEGSAADINMPIWMAARQTVPRYEAVLTSAGSRGKLIRRILVRMGLLQTEAPYLTLPLSEDESSLDPHLRPNHLSRVSMKDIFQPASNAVGGRNPFGIASRAFSVLTSESTLQEPAFKDLVLLYNGDGKTDSEESGLQLHTYKRIPIPDLKIVFPSKKLTFRVLDTLKLDITSIVGLLAFFLNYRFDDFLKSPSALVLDVIALSAFVVFITRVSFGYKQVWDQYQLLVNKTLYEKTTASGFGVVQFLVDESEEQQFKEAILVYLLLTHRAKGEGMTTAQLADACERFLYYRCKEQVEMPAEEAVATLVRLGLVAVCERSSEHHADDHFRALPFEQALGVLEKHWIALPSNPSHWN